MKNSAGALLVLLTATQLAGASIVDRLVTYPIDIAPYSTTSLVQICETADGTAIGWASFANKGEPASLHITRLDAHGARAGKDIVIPGFYTCQGIRADGDGFAVFVSEEGSVPVTMRFLRIDATGRIATNTTIIAPTSTDPDATDGGLHSCAVNRLHRTDSGWAIYWYKWTRGHQQDVLTYLDASGQIASGGWRGGASHSFGLRLSAHASGTAAITYSDAHPGKGVYFSWQPGPGALSRSPNVRISTWDPIFVGDPPAIGNVLPATGGGALLTYVPSVSTNHAARSCMLGMIAGDGSYQERPLSPNDASASYPRLGRYAGAYLATWVTDKIWHFQRIDAKGRAIGADESVTSDPDKGVQAPYDNPEILGFRNGDAGWAFTDFQRIVVVRLRAPAEWNVPVDAPTPLSPNDGPEPSSAKRAIHLRLRDDHGPISLVAVLQPGGREVSGPSGQYDFDSLAARSAYVIGFHPPHAPD